MLGILGVGGTAVLASGPSPDAAFPLMEREKVTVTAVVPPIADLWSQMWEWEPGDRSALRLIQVGGARLPAALARELGPGLGCRVQQVFGMAEGLLNYTRAEDGDDLVAETQGRPLSPDDEVRIVDGDGADVADGEIGELLTRGLYTIRGYYRVPEHNANAFTPDGYYRGGDLAAAAVGAPRRRGAGEGGRQPGRRGRAGRGTRRASGGAPQDPPGGGDSAPGQGARRTGLRGRRPDRPGGPADAAGRQDVPHGGGLGAVQDAGHPSHRPGPAPYTRRQDRQAHPRGIGGGAGGGVAGWRERHEGTGPRTVRGSRGADMHRFPESAADDRR
ncbi:AMP-binding protein [Yinghuangia aomiensis]